MYIILQKKLFKICCVVFGETERKKKRIIYRLHSVKIMHLYYLIFIENMQKQNKFICQKTLYKIFIKI